MFNVIICSSVLLLYFFIFTYNVPYQGAKRMADTANSGIWKWSFRFISYMGVGIHKVFNYLTNVILHKVRVDNCKLFKKLAHTIVFLGVLLLLTKIREIILQACNLNLYEELSESADGVLWHYIEKSFLFIDWVKSLQGESFFTMVGTLIKNMLLLFLIDTLFYATIFGFIGNRVRPWFEHVPDSEEEKLSIKEGIVNFIKDQSVLSNADSPFYVALVIIIVIVAIFMTMLGVSNGISINIFLKILDETDLIPITASIALTALGQYLLVKSCQAVIRVAPESIQNKINNISNKWEEKSIEYDNKIRKSSEEYAKNEYHPKYGNTSNSSKNRYSEQHYGMSDFPEFCDVKNYNEYHALLERGKKEGIPRNKTIKYINLMKDPKIRVKVLKKYYKFESENDFISMSWEDACWLAWDKMSEIIEKN